jgi:hypothetical protein
LREIIYKNTKLPFKIIAKCLIAIFKNKYQPKEQMKGMQEPTEVQ